MNVQNKNSIKSILVFVLIAYAVGLGLLALYCLFYGLNLFSQALDRLGLAITLLVAPPAILILQLVGEALSARIFSKRISQSISTQPFSFLRILYGVTVLSAVIAIVLAYEWLVK